MASGPTERFAGHEYPQRIPEPDRWRVGAPAPWADLAPAERVGLTLEVVTSRLLSSGRGLDDASRPSPGDPIPVADAAADAGPAGSQAAVLVALFEEGGETHVVLERRSTRLRANPGEVALPGGRREGDEPLVRTALREANEEVGADVGRAVPFATLTPVRSYASGATIWPVVARLDRRPALAPNPDEVDHAFTVSLALLAAEGSFREERWWRADRSAGGETPIYFFRVPGELIWGATARILVELVSRATGVAGSPEPSRGTPLVG